MYDKSYYEVFVLGKTGNYNENLVVKDFTNENVRDIKYQPDLDVHISCDFNVDPMAWVLAHKTENKVFILMNLLLKIQQPLKLVMNSITDIQIIRVKLLLTVMLPVINNRSCMSMNIQTM